MSAFMDQMDADVAIFFNTDDWAESVTYKPRSGGESAIIALAAYSNRYWGGVDTLHVKAADVPAPQILDVAEFDDTVFYVREVFHKDDQTRCLKILEGPLKSIAVVEDTGVSDGLGGYVDGTTTILTASAAVVPRKGREYMENARPEMEITHEVIIADPDPISIHNDMRITFEGRTLEIRTIIARDSDTVLELLCVEK